MKSLHLLFLGVLLVSADTQASWTNWRGPRFNGTQDGARLPEKLSGPESVAWETPLPGRGLSSPVIVGQRAFLTASSGGKQERLHVICFSTVDGSKIWERTFLATGRTMSHEKTSVAAPTPTSDGQFVYALYSSNDLVCLDLDGNLIWFRGLGLDHPNASNSLGMSSSLVTTDGVVLAQIENDSESLALGIDTRSGENLWKLERPKMANWCSPTIASRSDGSKAFCLQSGKGVLAVAPRTGKTIWDYSEGASTVASSAHHEGIIYAPSHGLTAFKPGAEGQPVEQIWRSGQLRPGTASPVIADGKVFALNDGGVLSAGELATGKRLWQLRLKGPFSSTPVAVGNKMLAVSEKGVVQLIDLSKPEGEVMSELDLKETVLGTPSLAEDGVYVRSDAKLWKLK